MPELEGTDRPTSVRLPYALVPGIDLNSRSYQKAIVLLGKQRSIESATPVLLNRGIPFVACFSARLLPHLSL